MGLGKGVNITVGLPVARTSVDHGTAFDSAGSGGADERSITGAMRQAVVLAPGRAAAASKAWSIFELHGISVRPGCLRGCLGKGCVQACPGLTELVRCENTRAGACAPHPLSMPLAPERRRATHPRLRCCPSLGWAAAGRP